MTITYTDAKEFNAWFAKARPGDRISYYVRKSLIEDCNKLPALERSRDAIWQAAFEVSVSDNKIRWHDKKTLFLVQRRIGPKPEGNAVGVFEYIVIRRGGQS
jgi:hypothetical protein